MATKNTRAKTANATKKSAAKRRRTKREAVRTISKTAGLERTGKRITAAQRKRAERARMILKGIHRLMKQVSQDSHRIGEQLTKLHELKLHESLGYRDFREMLKGERLMSASAAFRLMAVAKQYTRAQLLELGIDKAYALVTYVNTTPEDDIAALLADADAHVGGKPISQSTTREIKQAIAELKTEAPQESASTANRVVRALEALLEKRGARGFRVQPRVASGRWVVDVRLSLDDAMLLVKG